MPLPSPPRCSPRPARAPVPLGRASSLAPCRRPPGARAAVPGGGRHLCPRLQHSGDVSARRLSNAAPHRRHGADGSAGGRGAARRIPLGSSGDVGADGRRWTPRVRRNGPLPSAAMAVGTCRHRGSAAGAARLPSSLHGKPRCSVSGKNTAPRGARASPGVSPWVGAGRGHCFFLSYSPRRSPALPTVCGCLHPVFGAVQCGPLLHQPLLPL